MDNMGGGVSRLSWSARLVAAGLVLDDLVVDGLVLDDLVLDDLVLDDLVLDDLGADFLVRVPDAAAAFFAAFFVAGFLVERDRDVAVAVDFLAAARFVPDPVDVVFWDAEPDAFFAAVRFVVDFLAGLVFFAAAMHAPPLRRV